MRRETLVLVLLCLLWTAHALAVPDVVSVRVTDVTPSSFAVVWMTDVMGTPTVDIYGDAAESQKLNDQVQILPMPDAPQDVISAARNKGIMKVRVAGLLPETRYYVRARTVDPAAPQSIGSSQQLEVTTATATLPYVTAEDGSLQESANDLLVFPVYVRPADQGLLPRLGDLLILETPGAVQPITAFVGAGTVAPEGLIDLNNLYTTGNVSLFILGKEKAFLQIYRGLKLSTLTHARLVPVSSKSVAVQTPLKGFFADFNLDGKVDETDFTSFRMQYRTTPNDSGYNPDYKFVPSSSGTIDALDFNRFSREYGRTNVQ